MTLSTPFINSPIPSFTHLRILLTTVLTFSSHSLRNPLVIARLSLPYAFSDISPLSAHLPFVSTFLFHHPHNFGSFTFSPHSTQTHEFALIP